MTSTLDSPTHIYTTRGAYTVTPHRQSIGRDDTLTRTNYITGVCPCGTLALWRRPLSGVAPITVIFTNTFDRADYAPACGTWRRQHQRADEPHLCYSLSGVYTVTLTVSGPGGTDTLTRTRYITVIEPPPVAGFAAAPRSGVRPLTVNFTDASTGAVSTWLWNFGDAVTSTNQHPTHTYTVTGVYTVTLTVSGWAGTDTESQASFITVRCMGREPPSSCVSIPNSL